MGSTTMSDGTPGRESVFRTERRDDIGIIWFDVADRSQNVLRAGFEHDLHDALDELTGRDPVTAIVIASAKEGSFCAGADVNELVQATSAGEIESLSRMAHGAMDELRDLDLPVVAAIAGTCVGGGLELVLACDRRIAADDDTTEFGFPEVELGLIPGASGTQYLPRLIGLRAALDMMLTGDTVDASEARSMGLVDDVVHPAAVVETAVEAARSSARNGLDGASSILGRRDMEELVLAKNPLGRKVVFRSARSKVIERTGDRMPAPLRLLDVVRVGLEDGVEAGLDAEARAFGELAMTSQCQALAGLFLDRNELDSEADERRDVHDITVDRIGVIGGGLMGAGIAEVSLTEAGHSVRLRDIDTDATRDALTSIRDVLTARHVPLHEQRRRLSLITTTTDTTGFADVDVCIEAVVEDTDTKATVYGEIEPCLAADAVLATNTSSIPLAELADHVERRDRFVGMHYFSPVGRVPLLEVVRGADTSERTIAAASAVGRAQAKTVIVVNDGPGFYTSRILARYLDEASRIADGGVDPRAIDEVMEDIGFPVGPFKLLDEVGIDVGHEISDVLHRYLGDRFEPSALLEGLIADDRKGRKNGRGIYRYEPTGDDDDRERLDEIDPDVIAMLDTPPQDVDDDRRRDIGDRCVLALVTEAVRCLDESILDSARDGDVGAVFGLGFPPELGGPFRYIDQQPRGAADIVDACDALAAVHGERWAAPDVLRLAETGTRFRDRQRTG